MDADSERLTYVHNRGCYELEGEDYRGVLQLDRTGEHLPPYVEVVDLSAMERLSARSCATGGDPPSRAPQRQTEVNPIERLGERMREDLPWLRSERIPSSSISTRSVRCVSSARGRRVPLDS